MMKDQIGNPTWGEYFVYAVKFTSLATGTGVTYVDGEIRIDSDADFAFCKTNYYSTDNTPNIFIKYRDDSTGRYLTKSGVNLRSIGATALSLDNSGQFDFRAFIWPEPYYIRKSTTFMIQIANADAVIEPTLYLAFHGYKVRPGLAPWKMRGLRMPYTYSLSRSESTLPEGVVRVSANQTINAVINIDKDSDFVVNKITGGATGSALINIQEMGRDRQWMNTAVHVRNLLGSGAAPNILSQPRYVPKGATILVSIQDISGADNDVEIHLHGTKIFTKR